MRPFRSALPALLLSCAALPAIAQPVANDRLREQLRQTTIELRALQDQHQTLQLQAQQLQQQLEAAKRAPPPPPPKPEVDPAVVTGLQRRAATAEQEKRELANALTEARDALARERQAGQQSKDQVQRQSALLQQAVEQLRGLEAERRATADRLVGCAADNRALASLGDELIDRYERKDWWQTLRAQEPVFGLTRVRLENLAREWRDQVDAHRVSLPPVGVSYAEEAARRAPPPAAAASVPPADAAPAAR